MRLNRGRQSRADKLISGVPIQRPFMVFMFRILGFNIRNYHFSTEKDISKKAGQFFEKVSISSMAAVPSIFGNVYEIGQLH